MENSLVVIESPIFDGLRNDFNRYLVNLLSGLLANNQRSGKITCVLGVDIEEDVNASSGELFNKPSFNYKISSDLKISRSTDGGYMEDMELIFEDGQFVLRKVDRGQQKIGFEED